MEREHQASGSPKTVIWAKAAIKNLRQFPEEVKDEVGSALWVAQQGGTPDQAKTLQGFGGASVQEIVSDFDGDTYRAVYTVRFEKRIYVLHAFQKKSKRGTETPKAEIDLIKQRLRWAEEDYQNSLTRNE